MINPRVFRQLHCGFEGTCQAVLDDTHDGQRARAVPANVDFHR
jgi:hypothetical protein